VSELDDILAFEQRLLDEVLPELRERAYATDLQALLDRLLLEAEEHVAHLRRVPPPELPENGDLAILAELLRVQHAKLAAYAFLTHAAPDVRALRLHMDQDDYGREQAEHALARLLAEKVRERR
jgi:hypothetical protein